MILWLRMHRGGYTYIRDQFMLNPGCALAAVMGYMQGQGPGREEGSGDGGMKEMLDQALNLSIRLNKHYQVSNDNVVLHHMTLKCDDKCGSGCHCHL